MKVHTEITKDHLWQAIISLTDLLTSDEYWEEYTQQDVENIRVTVKHLWNAYNCIVNIDIYSTSIDQPEALAKGK